METCRFWPGKAEQLQYLKCLLIPQEFSLLFHFSVEFIQQLNDVQLCVAECECAPKKVPRASGCQGIYRPWWFQCPPLSGGNYMDSLTRPDMQSLTHNKRCQCQRSPQESQRMWKAWMGRKKLNLHSLWRWLKRHRRKNLQHDLWLSRGSESLYTNLSDNRTTQQGIKLIKSRSQTRTPWCTLLKLSFILIQS